MTAKRTDSTQTEIVRALRKIGASVFIISSVGKGCPDLLLGYRGRNYLVECKSGPKAKLTPLEQLFFHTWQGQVTIINSAQEAIDFVNKL